MAKGKLELLESQTTPHPLDNGIVEVWYDADPEPGSRFGFMDTAHGTPGSTSPVQSTRRFGDARIGFRTKHSTYNLWL